MLRKYLKNHIETNVPNKNVAVLMGGGVDAISVALSAHDVGKVVHVYSFHLEGHESYDYLKAKEKLIYEIKSIVEKNNGSFAFPSQSIYLEKN